MELNKIEILLEKYFEGETSIAEETELKTYFLSGNVAPHLKQYGPLFGYFAEEKSKKSNQELILVVQKRKTIWWSIAASVVVLIGVGAYTYTTLGTVNETKELGTYDNPEEAFKATQKALSMLSKNVNVGIEGVQYLQLYQESKEKVFVQ